MVLRSYVGAPVKRKEDPRLITGSSIYVDDITLPGMVHLAIVRSPYAHAKIVNIDTAEALTMPGVVSVVTGSDLAPMLTNKYPVEAYEGPGEPPEEYIPQAEQDDTIPVPGVEPLARRKVRYIGEPVAAVVAVSKAQAADAAAAVEVEYEAWRQPSIPMRRGSRAHPNSMTWSRTTSASARKQSMATWMPRSKRRQSR